jgi:hypothetical protein
MGVDNMKKIPYEKNICSKMTFEDLRNYLTQVFFEREIGIDLGYYSNFLQNEKTIQQRIEKTKGQAHYILQSKMDDIYNCTVCDY